MLKPDLVVVPDNVTPRKEHKDGKLNVNLFNLQIESDPQEIYCHSDEIVEERLIEMIFLLHYNNILWSVILLPRRS